jgi:hypothetical protein
MIDLAKPSSISNPIAAKNRGLRGRPDAILGSFDSVARLRFLPEPLVASIIEFHDIPRFSMVMIAALRFLTSGRPRHLPLVFALVIPRI